MKDIPSNREELRETTKDRFLGLFNFLASSRFNGLDEELMEFVESEKALALEAYREEVRGKLKVKKRNLKSNIGVGEPLTLVEREAIEATLDDILSLLSQEK